MLPVSDGADILVYRATHVPVGEDKSSILNLPRHRQKFNLDFPPRSRRSVSATPSSLCASRSFSGPHPRHESPRRLQKMSKSDPSDYSRINLSDDADTIAQKVRKAKTDPEALPSEVEGLKNRPRSRQPRRHFRRAQQ